MRHYFEERLFILLGGRVAEACIPDVNESVVGAAREKTGVEAMPCDVFYRSIVVQYFKNRQMLSIFLPILLDIPNANAFIGES